MNNKQYMKRKLNFILVLLLMVTQGAWAWSGSGTPTEPWLIQSVSDWNELANNVNNGTNYSGNYFRLTNDISVTTMVGNSESNSFRGTFDGNGHTLTITLSNNSNFTAPFRYIQGATFKNLKVTGTITTTMNLAAGIAGLNTNAVATFDQCITDITINSSSTTEVGWGRVDYHGGLLARTNNVNVNITDCVCGGSVNGSNGLSSISYGASFVGVAVSCTVSATRCLSTTSYTNVTTWNPLCHAADAVRSTSVFYYVNGNDVCDGATQVTASQLADGTIFTALQAGRAEGVWAQDPITNQPMLKLFANDGKLPGKFTINAGGGKVHFSRGNLQATTINNGSTWIWSFATNQYDCIGEAEANTRINGNGTVSANGTVDLFGWVGANSSLPAYGINNNSTDSNYGNVTSETLKSDWGHNAISNGGNTADLWRTLSKDEWVWLIGPNSNATPGTNCRTSSTVNGIANARFTYATINGTYKGIIVFPDSYTAGTPTGVTWGTINNCSNYTTTCTTAGWADLEAAGCVFLPAAGVRNGSSMFDPPSCSDPRGNYWSSTSHESNASNAYSMHFYKDTFNPENNFRRSDGYSVRLVYETPLQGTGTEQDPYLISSEADWYYLANKVNNGNTYSGKYFQLTEDVSVTTMVGSSESNSFRGTFDGDGHTLTFTKGSSESAFNEESCAPFRHVKNATITNLQVAGTIYTSAMRASGLVATSHGALTLAGCRSTVNINSSKSGDGTHGGLVAITTGSGNNVTIVGCVFDGSFATTSSTNSCGGFVGWTGENTPAITNSLMKPGCVAAGMLNNTFARWQSGYEPTITNCYYVATDNLPTDQGKLARNISAGDDVTISGLGVASATYDVSDITAYAHGIKYGSIFYAGNGDVVSLTLSHGNKSGFSFSQYTVSGGGSLANPTTNTPTLTMTDADQTIIAEWKKLLSNTDITIADIPSQAYNSTALTPVVSITDGSTALIENTDFSISTTTDCINAGEYEVTITGIGNYDGTANKTFVIVPAVTNCGAATITWDQSGKKVTFDGTSLATIDITSDIDVNAIVLSRTFTENKPATIMLPFSYTCNGNEGGKFYTFVGVEKEGTKWVATMKEAGDDKNNVTTLTANTPYLVVPTATTLTFTGGATLNTTGGGNQQTADAGSNWTFKGTYSYMKWTTDTSDPDYNAERADEIGKAYGFAGVQNTGIDIGDFVKVASGAKIRPMGCYLLWSDTPNASSAPARKMTRAASVDELPSRITVLLVSANGETTGIGELNTATGEISLDGWWTLDGVKLSGKPAKKGLYIHNGRKEVLK